MAKKLYVGNLPWGVTDEKLHDLFNSIGAVESARIITDRVTGKSRGFGFIVMTHAEDADAAIQRLNGETVGDRKIGVTEAIDKPRGDKPAAPRAYSY